MKKIFKIITTSLLMFSFIFPAVASADTTFTSFINSATSKTTAGFTDVFPVIDNSGTAVTKKLSLLQLNASINLASTTGSIDILASTTGTLTAARGGTGLTSLGSGIATWLGTPSSANLLSALTDKTGTGLSVFQTNATLVTPILGTPQSVNLSNGTALPLTSGVTGTLPILNGGTNATSFSNTFGTNVYWNGTSLATPINDQAIVTPYSSSTMTTSDLSSSTNMFVSNNITINGRGDASPTPTSLNWATVAQGGRNSTTLGISNDTDSGLRFISNNQTAMQISGGSVNLRNNGTIKVDVVNGVLENSTWASQQTFTAGTVSAALPALVAQTAASQSVDAFRVIDSGSVIKDAFNAHWGLAVGLPKITDSATAQFATSTDNAGTLTTNATTTLEIGTSGTSHGSCMILYDQGGTAVYAFIPKGSTTFTLSSTAASCI